MSGQVSGLASSSYERMAGDGTGGYPPSTAEQVVSQTKEAGKLKQIIQRFFTKAALTIISSRVNLPQCFARDSNQIRSNRWFGLIIDESDVLFADLTTWSRVDITEERPPPLIIEVYLDTAELTHNQSLVTVDERGRRWDVREALTSPTTSAMGVRKSRQEDTQVIIERWKVYLGDSSLETISNSSDTMPNVYKKAVVLFRSLYTYSRFLPAWKFVRRMAKQPATLNALRPLYRIYSEDPNDRRKDLLRSPLYPTGETTTQTYRLNPTKSPAGPLCIEVSYRTNCDFRVDDSEALLSSRFVGMDDRYFQPSLGDTSGKTPPFLAGGKDIGSLPTDRKFFRDRPDMGQAYGSMSTFHHLGYAPGTSPMSALRHAGDMTSGSPTEASPPKIPPNHRTSQSSKSSLRSIDGTPTGVRRVSVSFQPFKAGSLSSSPIPGTNVPPASGLSLGRTSNISSGFAQARNRNSLTPLPQGALRGSQAPANEVAVESPTSSSPKAPPITRYSSSFGHRRSRFSSGGGSSTNKTEDDNSSGKASLNSSSQPNSGLLAEGEEGSSGSLQTDDDNISDFLKFLTEKKDLKSFNRTDDASRDASARRTTAALSKFHRLRDSHAALTDSLSSSMMLQRSSGISSRQLSGVPPMLVGASVSTSSSPGKPISPHTPHTPAIPSRLSANTMSDDTEPRRNLARTRPGNATLFEGDISQTTPLGQGSTAIDIPTSPQHRPYIRRSSSAMQHQRGISDEFGMRSASLPLGEAPDLSVNEILALQEPHGEALTADQSDDLALGIDLPLAPHRDVSTQYSDRNHSASVMTTASGAASRAPFRTTFSRSGGSGRGSISSAASAGGSGSATFDRAGSERAGRYSFSARRGSAAVDDDEPLLFTMSDMNQPRRSLEEGQGGAHGAGERGGGGGAGGLDSGATARRSGRRGAGGWL